MNSVLQNSISSEETIIRLNVGEVRNIDIQMNDQKLGVDVEVESRSSHVKSHAGIFTRIEGVNIKGGQAKDFSFGEGKITSTSMILQKMRWNLLQLARIGISTLMRSGNNN